MTQSNHNSGRAERDLDAPRTAADPREPGPDSPQAAADPRECDRDPLQAAADPRERDRDAARPTVNAPELDAREPTSAEHEPNAITPIPPIPSSVSAKRLALIFAALVLTLLVGAVIGPPIGKELRALWSAAGGSKDAGQKSSAGPEYYTCGMHPWVIVPTPGACPICGMDLVPLDPAKFSGEITIDPVVIQNIGVRVEKVEEGSETGSIRTVGTVTYDETLLGDVNLKVAGWVEKLYVDYLGAPVKRGQPLFELYSPELYAAQGEYLLAYRASQRVSSKKGVSSEEGSSTGGLVSELLEPARTKLSLYDVGPAQIKQLEARGKPLKTMTIWSPQSGVVIEKQVFEGMKMTPGMTAYRIADLSRVWVMATIYEYQSRDIELGQKATMTLSYLPGQEVEGKVVYIYPFLDERTRQLNVRLEFPNPDLKLKPGMYATVVFQGTSATKRVLAPRSAVIDTGERQVAFVAKGQGRFEPRTIRMGAETEDGKVEILDGLRSGELVVVSGQFLIDSEARMREALAKMMKGTTETEATAAPPAVESATLELSDAASTALSTVLDGYLAIGKALASDTTTNIGVAARKVVEAIDALVAMPMPEHPHIWHEHPEAAAVRAKAAELAAVRSLDEARRTFASLSSELSKLLNATGVPKSYDQKLEDAHCPMYPDGSETGSLWIEVAGAVRNPYFGEAMSMCADWQRPLQVAR